jgi:nitrogen fixation NifU-like protein
VSRNLEEFVENLQEQVLEQARQQYSEQVIARWMHPRRQGCMKAANGHGKVTGSCGDSMEIFIRAENERISEASFLTDGCMTTIVSASMAADMAIDRSIPEALTITQADILEALGGLPEESQHCALLAAKALRAAIDDYHRNVEESSDR